MRNEQSQDPKNLALVDRLGAFASTACALHCVVCALLPATFATLGLGFLVSHETEWLLTGLAVSFAVCALFFGWRRHRNMRVIGLLSIGMIGLLAARNIEGGEHHHGPDNAQAEYESNTMHPEVTPDHHATEHGETHGEGQLIGESLGILGGIILCIGHILNMREWKRPQQSELDSPTSSAC